MTNSNGKIRNITGASIEAEVPVQRLRRWDPIIKPLRVGNGPNAVRGYGDSHIEIAKKLAALDKK